MSSSSRFPALPLLISALFVRGLAADDVQQLPTMEVTDAAGGRAALPSVVLSPAGIDPSAGLAATARYTAGLMVNDAGARGFGQTTTLRGLGNTPFFSDSSSPVYLDDIPLASAFTFPTELYDFAAVTVHRGPQANTQFGQAGDAGVIQLVSGPDAPRASGHARVTLGNFGALGASASAATGTMGASDLTAAVSTSRRDGYIRNTELHQRVDDRESTAGRVRWRYRPSADLEVTVQALGQRARDGAQALVPLGGPLDEVQRSQEGESDFDFGAASVGVKRRLADGVLSATTAISKWELSPYSNRLVVFGGANFDSVLAQSQRTFSEELHFATERYSGGAYYANARTRGATDRVFDGFPVERSGFTTDAETLALFGRTNLTTAAGWVITPGLRVETLAKDFRRTEQIPNDFIYDRDDRWTAFLPSLSASRRLNEESDVRFTVSRGFKPGGFSAFTGRVDLTQFDPQTTWGLEAAYSARPRGGKFSYTARAYAYRVRGYQIERSFAVPDTSTDEYLVVNAERARVLGLELESNWSPAADWNVALAVSVAQARLERFTDPFTGTSYNGNQAPFAPHGNGAVRVEYHPARGIFAGTGVTWTGTTYYDEQETAFFAQRAYALIDAEAGYTFARGDVAVFGRNLGDRAYYSSITPGVAHGTPGAPMTWGVECNLHW